jgi:hypothetical protein
MAKRKKSVDLESTKGKVDKEMSSLGLNYHKLLGVILLLIGIILVAVNVVRVLEAFVGLVLIYFGLKMVGYTVKL